MTIKVKKGKTPIKRKIAKKTGQKQKQKQVVNVKVNIDNSVVPRARYVVPAGDQSKKNVGLRKPIIKEPDVKPKILNLPTFYSQPSVIPTLNNNILKDEKLRKEQEVKLGDFSKNVSNLSNIPNKEVEQVINNLTSDNPTTNKQEIAIWNLGVDKKLKTEPVNIVSLNEDEKQDNELSNLVYHSKKTEEQKEVNEAIENNEEQEDNQIAQEPLIKEVKLKTLSTKTKKELVPEYYRLVELFGIENPLNNVEINGYTYKEFKNIVTDLYNEEKKVIKEAKNSLKKIQKLEKQKLLIEEQRDKSNKPMNIIKMNKKIDELQEFINEQTELYNKFGKNRNNIEIEEES
jgi:hypothetical protein